MRAHEIHLTDAVGTFNAQCRTCQDACNAVLAADEKVKAMRDKLALIEVTVALWEAGAVEMRKHPYRMGDHVRADVFAAHAEQVRSILKGE